METMAKMPIMLVQEVEGLADQFSYALNISILVTTWLLPLEALVVKPMLGAKVDREA